MAVVTLQEQDFQDAARRLRCDVPAIRAVAEVESSGSGFLADGRPRILFEGHIFSRYTKGIYNANYPDISYPKWDVSKYAKGPNAEARGQGEWARLIRAKMLNERAALFSASYGMFQIMGFNHSLCGYTSVDTFVEDMGESARNHLLAFCEYIVHVRLDDELRNHYWKEFAKRYNGPMYQKNRYDEKLALAYARHVAALKPKAPAPTLVAKK